MKTNTQRKDILRDIIRNKFALRKMLGIKSSLTNQRMDKSRRLRLLESKNSPFTKNEEDLLKIAVESSWDTAKDINGHVVSLARYLHSLAGQAENCLSFHDKCQVVGISHIAAKNKLKGDTSVDLVSMIFVYNLEENRNADFVVECELTPLASGFIAMFRDELLNNKEFSEKINEGMDEFFGALPRYQKITYADGSEEFVRMPPKLTVVNNKRA